MSGPEERFDDPSRPWGWWMTMDRSGFVVDEQGRRFRSVRDALWRGRLGLDLTDEREAGIEMERLLAYLVSISRKAAGRRERLIEVFEEDARMPAFVEMWARGQGLLDEDSALTVEGHAAMLMLAVTRDLERGPTPVGRDELPIAGPDAGRAAREAMFERAEAFGRRSEWRFERTMVGSVFAISLSGRVSPRALPAEATVWTCAFLDQESRDAMFQWICLRVDRWRAWGDNAGRFGAAWLTDHLFTLIACGMAEAVGGGATDTRGGSL